jgi:hypothetical protein
MDPFALRDKLLKQLDESISSVSDYILEGGPQGEVAYQKAVGKRLALVEARDIVVNTFARVIEEDDIDGPE